jgi:hypothetical protein
MAELPEQIRSAHQQDGTAKATSWMLARNALGLLIADLASLTLRFADLSSRRRDPTIKTAWLLWGMEMRPALEPHRPEPAILPESAQDLALTTALHALVHLLAKQSARELTIPNPKEAHDD